MLALCHWVVVHKTFHGNPFLVPMFEIELAYGETRNNLDISMHMLCKKHLTVLLMS
jgi:hypothetical protein